MTTLDTTVTKLTDELAWLDSAIAQLTAEQEHIDQALASAPPAERPVLRERRLDVARDLEAAQRERPHVEARLEPALQQQSGQAGRVSAAHRFFAALQSPLGLDHPDFRTMPVPILKREAARKRQILEAAGETVNPVTIKI